MMSRGVGASPTERVTKPVIDPLNLTWIIPAEGSTDKRLKKAGPSGSAFFVQREGELIPDQIRKGMKVKV